MAAPLKHMKFVGIFSILRKTSIGFRVFTKSKHTINDLLTKGSQLESTQVSAYGWLKSCRKQKKYTFFHLNDGTSSDSLQVVTDTNLSLSELSVGCSVKVNGHLVKSPGKGQTYELQADNVKLLGKCDNDLYPLKTISHTAESLRQYPHLRPRNDEFNQLLCIRNTATMAVHKYFQDSDYIQIHTPIITSNDCEGAGEVFHVTTGDNTTSTTTSCDKSTDSKTDRLFFDHPTYLTVSGQLHLEAMTGAFNKVYTFGPTFRAENSVGRHHLAEFYMIEAEIAFTDGLTTIIDEMEQLVKSTCTDIVNKHEETLSQFWKSSKIKDLNTICNNLIKKDYIRMSYTEAIKLLEQNNENFKFKVKWGNDLQKEHEKYLVKLCDNTPVFVTDYPASIKPFYARLNDDSTTVAAVDLLVPGVGELFGGSIREERLSLIEDRLHKLGITDTYQWYLDLRRYGSAPHGGFGMGFERLLQCFLGVNNIKDTIPFPRWPHNCLM